MSAVETIRARLLEMQDPGYQTFQQKLLPNIPPEKVIGDTRSRVSADPGPGIGRDPGSADFLACLPHEYYEENNLHGFLLERISDYDTPWQR